MADDDDKKPKPPARKHRATFARDKRKGGYLVRVEGPNCTAFAGREVPVTLKNGDENVAMLDGLIWSGNDEETGKPIALYSMVPTVPGDEQEEIPF
jgi:hypothetical protein